jgi:TetR/AcrR family transcriptional repressor of nem operon
MNRRFGRSLLKFPVDIDAFFLACIRGGQADGTVTLSLPAEILSQDLLGVLMGIRVLARVRPERALLEGVAAPALALLRVGTGAIGTGAK